MFMAMPYSEAGLYALVRLLLWRYDFDIKPLCQVLRRPL
jgi:hypothetical protein